MLNHVVLMGRLTADPEVSYTPNNTLVARATLAVERSYAPKGQERKADFLNLIAWKQQGEFLQKHFQKGQLVAVEGSIQTESYTDNQGIKRKKFEILVERLHFAEPKRQTSDVIPPPSDWSGSFNRAEIAAPTYRSSPGSQPPAQNSQSVPALPAQYPFSLELEQEQFEDLPF